MLALALRVALNKVGYEVTSASDGTAFADVVDLARPDLALIDVALPSGPNGFELARQLRTRSDAPIMFITAADSLEDRLAGFDVGADDYLVKPFALAELLARVGAVLRRTGRLISGVVEVRDMVIDEQQRVVLRAGERVRLTPTEFELLLTLAESPGRVFSKGELLSRIWGFENYAPNLVEVHISALRRKIEDAPVPLIYTERGRGYVLRP
jgi:DNA-binding response OmpR family regulator